MEIMSPGLFLCVVLRIQENFVSIHSSFRTGSSASKHRNVLSRQERLDKLEEQGRWDTSKDGLFGLPKVRSIKVAMKKKKKKDAEEEEAK